VTNSTGLSWFRLRRESASRFLVTCGAGATTGFRSWTEVTNAGAADQFGDRGTFDELRMREYRMWFLIEWSAAARDSNYHCIENDIGDVTDNYIFYAMNASTSNITRTQSHCRDDAGSIRWIQRLREEPTRW
jgi:hypothetical protein